MPDNRERNMKKKLIQLPKTYLSYSQIQLWKSSRARYIELYMNNNQAFRLENSGMAYGKVVADALEKGLETGDLLTDAAMLLLPKYDVADKEIRATIKTKEGSFDIIGRPDSLDSKTKAYIEYKTGKGAWTLAKAQKHPQMLFYALLIYLAYGVVLNEAKLIWIQTEDVVEQYGPEDWLQGEKKSIKPTGHIETFEVKFTLAEILNCLADTIRIAKEIELVWLSHIPQNTPQA